MMADKFRHLDLFSGQCGNSLAAQSVWGENYENIGFCEIEPFAQALIKEKYVNARIFPDIKTLDPACIGRTDLITAGAPCQPASNAGKRKGTGDTRWLWPRTLEVVFALRPHYAILENVYGLVSLEGGFHSKIYSLSWKMKATKQSRLYFQLQALAPRISGPASGSWPTPTVADAFTDKLRSSQQKEGSMHSVNLSQAVRMWPTPTVGDASGGANKVRVEKGKLIRDAGTIKHSANLQSVVMFLEKFPPPAVAMHKGSSKGAMIRKSGRSRIADRLDYAVEQGNIQDGRLNPDWVEWLMGYPTGWTALRHWGIQSSRKSRKK